MLKFGKVVILVAITVVIVSGLVSYQIWLEPEPVPVEAVQAPACDICSALKKDLAEQVRERKQNQKQKQ